MNSSCLTTRFLPVTTARSLCRAALAQASSTRRLTVLITINLEQAAHSGESTPRALFASFQKAIVQWLARNTLTPALYVYVFENPRDVLTRLGGLHVHELVHVPEPLLKRLRKRARKWIRTAGGKLHRGVLDIRVLDHAFEGSSEDYLSRGLRPVLAYLLKGTNEAGRQLLEAEFGLEFKDNWITDQGRITGKRAGASEALWRLVRQATRPSNEFEMLQHTIVIGAH